MLHRKQLQRQPTTVLKQHKKKFEDVFDRKKLYDWQVDVTEALLLGLDCVAIAGTGAGKAMPFGMPLLMDESGSKIVIVNIPGSSSLSIRVVLANRALG